MKIDPSVLSRLTPWQWKAQASGEPNHDLLSHARFIGTPVLYFAMAEVFWPEVLTRDGRLFLASRWSEDTYRQWLERGLSGPELQRVLNHVHVKTLLQGEADIDLAVATEVARVICRFWQAVFQEQGARGEVIEGSFDDLAVTLVQP